MFNTFLEFILNTAKLFGLRPWLYSGNSTPFKWFALLYPGILVTVLILQFRSIISSQLRILEQTTAFSVGMFLVFTIISNSYVKTDKWRTLDELFDEMKSIQKKKMFYTMELRCKYKIIFAAHCITFAVVTLGYYIENDDYDIEVFADLKFFVIIYIHLFLMVLIAFTQEGFRRVRIELENINQQTYLRISTRSVENAKSCRNTYMFLYDVFKCYQDIFTWIFALMYVELLFTMVFIADNLIDDFIGKQDSTVLKISKYGNVVQHLVSESFKLC